MKYIFFYLAAAIVLTAAIAPKKGYTITGEVTGLPENTWLYLQVLYPFRDIDSCQIINGKFKMEGRIPEKAAKAIVATKDHSDYIYFWMENTAINMQLTAGNFTKGAITDTPTAADEKAVKQLREPFIRQSDSVRKLQKATPDTLLQQQLKLQLKRLREQDQQAMQNWIATHPHSVYAACLLEMKSDGWGKAVTNNLYNKLSTAIQQCEYGKHVKNYIDLRAYVKVGDKSVDFEQPNTEGKMVRLSTIKAKYILLDFWGSGCGPCLTENRELIKTYAKFKEKGFEVLAVSLDDNKDYWLKRIQLEGYPWQNVSDLQGQQNKAAIIYGIKDIPSSFLIDEHGTIIASDLRGKSLSDKLEQLLP